MGNISLPRGVPEKDVLPQPNCTLRFLAYPFFIYFLFFFLLRKESCCKLRSVVMFLIHELAHRSL